MQTIVNNKGIETIIYAETFENEAYEQIKKLANFEAYDESKIRIMPDAHAGKGCTVGTTIQLIDKVTPNLVGVDIGCGMFTVKLTTKDINFAKLDRVINTQIPHGFNVRKEAQTNFDFSKLRCGKDVDLKRAALSIGSLGGGNHFIELSQNQDNMDVYLIIHSGSRKLGGDVCKYYQEKAYWNTTLVNKEVQATIDRLKKEGRRKEIESAIKKLKLPVVDKDLAYLIGKDFEDYMNDMSIVQNFAHWNRVTMASIIMEEMDWDISDSFETIHNYIDFKRMILRKGAVSAEKDETLLIPINMRDGSLLCTGLGNPDWNYSAPHGAGRLMSRSKAKEILKMEDFEESMQDIYTTSVKQSTLDEAPQAYKSIEEIIRTISDTVTIQAILKPLYNFKSH